MWVLIDAKRCYVYNFNIYCGKRKEMLGVKVPNKAEPQVGLKLVKQMVRGLDNLGHVVVTDNFLTSILFT